MAAERRQSQDAPGLHLRHFWQFRSPFTSRSCHKTWLQGISLLVGQLRLLAAALLRAEFNSSCPYRRAGQATAWKAAGQFGARDLEAEEPVAPCQAKPWADAGVSVNDGLDSLGTDKGQLCTILRRVLHRSNRSAL